MENILVAARIRPLNSQERNNLEVDLWKNDINTNTIMASTDSYNELIKMRKIIPGQRTAYTLDKTFDKIHNNTEIYENVVKRIALSSLHGINGTVFMYGQTGSGKTFTMMGLKYQEMLQYNQQFMNSNGTPGAVRKARNKSQETKKISANTLHKKHFSSKSPQKNLQPLVFQNQGKNMIGSFGQNNTNGNNNKSFSTKPFLSNNESRDQPSTTTLSNNDTSQTYMNNQQDFEGSSNKNGILVMALQNIFKEIEDNDDKQYFLRCSYIEIYTDFVYDLLKEREQLQETCTINEDQNKEFYIKGAKDEMVSNIEDVLELLYKGEQNRHYASTTMNHVSSRSHTIFRLYVRAIPKNLENAKEGITESVLNFVDLAGSEKIANHNFSKQRTNSGTSIGQSYMQTQIKERQNESKNINKSLFFLTQVISLKSQGKPDIMIPFRNSPLTKILRSSLGGNSRTAIILCINPCTSQLEQSFSTLRFGLNAKKIQNQVQRNIVQEGNDEVMKGLILEYEKRIKDIENEKKNSQNLLQIIEKLNEQKNNLQKRLNQANEHGFIVGQGNRLFALRENLQDQREVSYQDNMQVFYDSLHFDSIGIVSVLQKHRESKSGSNLFSNHIIGGTTNILGQVNSGFNSVTQNSTNGNGSQDNYVLQALRNVNSQKDLLVEKNKVLEKKLDEYCVKLEQEKQKYMQNIQKKQQKKKELKAKSIILEQENIRLKQIMSFYQNKNITGLKHIQNSQFLRQLEDQLYNLIDNIKIQKNMVNFQHSVNLIENSSQQVFKDQIQKLIDIQKFTQNTENLNFPDEFYEVNSSQIQENSISLLNEKKLKSIESQLTSIQKQPSQNNKSDDNDNFLSFQNYFNTKREEHQILVESYDDKLSQMNIQYENFMLKLKQPPICEITNNANNLNNVLNTEASVSTQVFKEPLKHFDMEDMNRSQNSCYSVQSSMRFSKNNFEGIVGNPLQQQQQFPQHNMNVVLNNYSQRPSTISADSVQESTPVSSTINSLVNPQNQLQQQPYNNQQNLKNQLNHNINIVNTNTNNFSLQNKNIKQQQYFSANSNNLNSNIQDMKQQLNFNKKNSNLQPQQQQSSSAKSSVDNFRDALRYQQQQLQQQLDNNNNNNRYKQQQY